MFIDTAGLRRKSKVEDQIEKYSVIRARMAVERADVCAVSACGVVAEAMVANVLANAILEKFGGDSIEELKSNYNNYLEMLS